MQSGKRVGLCLLAAGCVLALCGGSAAPTPGRAAAVECWNETATLYNKVAEAANGSGRSMEEDFAVAMEEASVLLAQSRAALPTADKEQQTAWQARLEALRKELTERQAQAVLPYSPPEERLWQATTAAADLYRELFGLIKQNGWDYDPDTVAEQNDTAALITEAAALLGEEAPDPERVAWLCDRLAEYTAGGDAKKGRFSGRLE